MPQCKNESPKRGGLFGTTAMGEREEVLTPEIPVAVKRRKKRVEEERCTHLKDK